MTTPRILILGADGFIGRHIAVHLRNQQLDILCAVRNPSRLKAMGFETMRIDLSKPEQLQEPLSNIDVIINCAGLLSGSDQAMQHVHATGPEQVYRTGKSAGVRKIILISAVGIDADTAFGRYKTMGEEVLKTSKTPYVILRPSMVLAETSYGGSSLMRGLAMMPFITPVVGNGDQVFDPVHADDLAETVHLAVTSDQLDNKTLPVCGPERITQLEMLTAYRGWLGQPAQRVLKIPTTLARGLGRLGDWLKLGPISSTAVAQIEHGVGADYPAFHTVTNITPKSFTQILATRPAGTQDLWHARLYLLKPLVRFGLLAMWLISGLVGLFLPPERFLSGLSGAGFPEGLLTVLARSAGAIDILIALGLLFAWRLKHLATIQLAMVGTYTLAFGLLFPALWLEPYGGLLKNIPVLLLILTHRILEEER